MFDPELHDPGALAGLRPLVADRPEVLEDDLVVAGIDGVGDAELVEPLLGLVEVLVVEVGHGDGGRRGDRTSVLSLLAAAGEAERAGESEESRRVSHSCYEHSRNAMSVKPRACGGAGAPRARGRRTRP